MKIKHLNLYTYVLYIMLAVYMLGPALPFEVDVPRIDSPLTLIFVLPDFVVFLLENKHIPYKIFAMLCALTAMCIWPATHVGITSLTPMQYMDILPFMAIPASFYLFYRVLKRAGDPLRTIQKFLVVFTLFIAVPPSTELATGVQFMSTSDELAVGEGSLEGLFFNSNNLTAAAVCLVPAILFSFQLQGRKHKEKLLDWGLFLLLGMAILTNVSRIAVGCYLLTLLVYTAYRKNGFITVGVTGLLALVLSVIPSRAITEFLLSLNGDQFLERFSSRVHLFLYDLDNDNSMPYRQRIYNHFWSDPPLLLIGCSPKNFRGYFGGHLSGSLGFENPHSFIIGLYLGSGTISLLGFIIFVTCYFLYTASNRAITDKSRVLAWAALDIFLLAGFVPSTILRMPFIWLPCLLVFVYSVFVAPKLEDMATYAYDEALYDTKRLS